VTSERPEELPPELWARVTAFVEESPGAPVEPLVDALVEWAEGRHPDALEDLLDALRGRRAYVVSLGLLEAAWNSDLPPERMGRIVEDWIGSVKFGLDDSEGAEIVARHIAKTAHRHGQAFVADLGDLLLGWSMYEVAGPLVESAAKAMPGDLSVQFNCGVIQKMKGAWADAQKCFQQVLRHRDDQASRWNLGIACTALGDWSGARDAWTKLGMKLPGEEGDFAHEEGDTTALRLPFTDAAGSLRHEIVWARRLGPARARLRTIPRFSTSIGYGDTLLIDGVTVGETELEGEQVPIFEVLDTLEKGQAEVLIFRRADTTPTAAERVQALALQLNHDGWPAANWSNMVNNEGLCLAVAVEKHRDAESARLRVGELSATLDLEWNAPDPTIH